MQRQAAVALHGCVKSAIVAGQKKRRDTMRVINTSELAYKTLPQLIVMYSEIAAALAETKPGSVERANMMVTLMNCARLIEIMRRRRAPKC
jgi:hypothetical protein